MVRYVNDNVLFSFAHHTNSSCTAKVIIKVPLVSALYNHILSEQKKHLQTDGFAKGSVPLAYIESTCKNYILSHLKEFFFNHSVVSFLYQELYNNKLVAIGEPVLKDISVEPGQDAEFTFFLNTITPDVKHEWKKFPFKAPGRKNYKDLDRQVENFLKDEEEKRAALADGINSIQISDWVCFLVKIITDGEHKELLSQYQSPLWLKIGREDPDKEAHALFLGKKVGDVFFTHNNFLQSYFSKQLETSYNLEITIIDHLSGGSFSLDLFKHHFKIKSLKELHLKFIEVFSFRNDISQRREIIESAFKTLLKYYHIHVPTELIEEQRNLVLRALRRNPDYPVYKAQKDFNKKVHLLAEKQLKETILIDHIAQQEQIVVSQEDIRSYLNMLQRPRTREFIHFSLPLTQLSGQEQPVPSGIIYQATLREKTLNHIIQRLVQG